MENPPKKSKLKLVIFKFSTAKKYPAIDEKTTLIVKRNLVNCNMSDIKL